MSAIMQVWSAPSCQSGAVCFGALAEWVSAAGSESTGAPASFRVTVTRANADRVGLAEGRCLRVLSQSRGEQWWFVSSVTDSDGDLRLVNVTAGPLVQLLTVRGLVRSGSTFAFSPGKKVVQDLLSAYVLTNLADDGLSWLSLGTIDFTHTIEVGDITRETRAAVLTKIEAATGHTARLRAVYAAGVLTGFAVDVVQDVAAGLATVPLSVGAQVTQLQRTRDALRAATVAVPFDASGRPMERAVWVVDSISGTAPAWLTLRDPVLGNPWPIREDDQLNGLYLEQRDGTQTIVADSRASDSAVQVASLGSLVAGERVTLVRDPAGGAVVEVTAPSAVASPRGRLVGTVSTTVTDARRNYAANGLFTTWTSDTAPANYTIGGTPGGVGRYPKTTAAGTADLSLQLDGALAIGATTIPVRGGVAGQRVYWREYFVVNGAVGYVVNAEVVTFDGTGRASLPIVGTTTATAPDGATVTVLVGTSSNAGPQRPESWPDEPTVDVCRLLAQGTTVQSVPSLIRAASSGLRVGVAAGLSIRASNESGSLSAGFWPTLQLRNTVAGTTLASASSPAASLSATAHYTLTASATIAANTTVAARVVAGNNNTTGNTFLQWQGVRWLSLWVGDGPAMGLQDGSGTNQLWHRAQDVLASAGQGTRYQVRGVDLRRLQTENVALALGQSVRLRSEGLGLDATVKIVKLDYDFTNDEALNLELGAVVPRLSGVTVSL